MKHRFEGRRRIRLSAVIATLGALALAGSLAPVAGAQLAAGASKASLNVPVPASARILSAANNTLQVCYDHPVATIAHPTFFSVLGYDVNRENPAVSATKAPGSPDCVNVQFATGPNAPPLTDFTRASAFGTAVAGTDGKSSLGGGLALDGTTQSPRAGNTAGPDLVAADLVKYPQITPHGLNRVITYTFDQELDATPGVVPPHVFNSPTSINNAFGYYSTNGAVITCGDLSASASPGVYAISGDSVECRIPAATIAANPPSRFFVQARAVRNRPTAYSCCDVNPVGSVGASAGLPVLTGFTQTGPASATVTYSEPVSIRNGALLRLYGSDGSAATPTSVTQGSTSNEIQVRFPASLANAAYKVVGISDPGSSGPLGAAVQGQRGGAGGFVGTPPPSATTYFPIRTAPIQAGRIDGPDLQLVTVNKTNDTATFVFRGLVASISTARGALGVADFHLVDVSGNITSGTHVVSTANGSPTALDPTSRVTVSFPAAAVNSARAAQILDGDVVDFQGKEGLRNTVAISNPGTQLFGHTAFVSPGGTAGVSAGCFSPTGCSTSIAVRIRTGSHRIIARRSFRLGYDSGGIVHLSLSRAGRQLLRSARHGQLGTTTTVVDSSGRHTASFTLARFITTGSAVNPRVSGNSLLPVFGRTAFVSGGDAGVFLACFFTAPCQGSLTVVSQGGTRLGSRHSFTVAPGDGGIVHVTVSHSARVALARHGTLVVRVTVVGPLGAAQSTTLRLVRLT